MKSRKGMNPVMGLIFFAVALIGFLYVSVGFLGSMGDASHVYEDELDKVTANASEPWDVVEVEPVTYGVEKDSETIYSGTQTLEKPENYSVVDYSTGKFNITDLSGSGEKTLDVEYRNEVDSEVTGDIDATGDIFQTYSEIDVVIPALILGAIILGALYQ